MFYGNVKKKTLMFDQVFYMNHKDNKILLHNTIIFLILELKNYLNNFYNCYLLLSYMHNGYKFYIFIFLSAIIVFSPKKSD